MRPSRGCVGPCLLLRCAPDQGHGTSPKLGLPEKNHVSHLRLGLFKVGTVSPPQSRTSEGGAKPTSFISLLTLGPSPWGAIQAPTEPDPPGRALVPPEEAPQFPGRLLPLGLRSRSPFLVPALAPAPRTVTSLIYRSEETEKPLSSLFLSHSKGEGQHRDQDPDSPRAQGGHGLVTLGCQSRQPIQDPRKGSILRSPACGYLSNQGSWWPTSHPYSFGGRSFQL